MTNYSRGSHAPLCSGEALVTQGWILLTITWGGLTFHEHARECLDSNQIACQNPMNATGFKLPISLTTTIGEPPARGPGFQDPAVSDCRRVQAGKVAGGI